MDAGTGEQYKIYLAYRSIFSGANAHIRTRKDISQRIISCKETSSTPVTKRAITVLKPLLEHRIFEFETLARQALPQLSFTTAAQRQARREAKEAREARSEAEALRSVAGKTEVSQPITSEEEVKKSDQTTDQGNAETRSEHVEDVREQADSQQARTETSLVPSLYPIQMSFLLQHRILCTIQKLLEKCCFDFTTIHNPEILTAQGWDCVERVELHCWTLIYRKRFTQEELTATQVGHCGVTLQDLLLAVNHIRHAAVHRRCFSSQELIRTIEDAIEFAELLGFADRTTLLQELHAEMKSTVKSQELHKSFLKVKLARELDNIEKIRAELDQRQQDAIQAMLVEDAENDRFVNSAFELSFEKLLTEDHAMADTFEECSEMPEGADQNTTASKKPCNGW